MRTIPAELVELEDKTTWLRLPGRMIEIDADEAHWAGLRFRAAIAEDPPEGPVALAQLPAPEKPAAKPSRKPVGESRPAKAKVVQPKAETKAPVQGARALMLAQARALVEEQWLDYGRVGKQVGRSGQSIANWAEKHRWVSLAKVKRAHGLMERRGYSLSRAASAVKLDADRLATALERFASESLAAAPKVVVTESVRDPNHAKRTAREMCPECKRYTHANPCQHCFNPR